MFLREPGQKLTTQGASEPVLRIARAMAGGLPGDKLCSVPTVDLNADLGEGCASEPELLELVSSANISCGAHAGDARTMRVTIQAAARLGISIGAHPGYPDREGFGRREIGASPAEIERLVETQLLAFADACADSGATFGYVKPHGALYNRATTDDDAAESIARAVVRVDPSLVVLGMPGGALLLAAAAAGLPVAREAFLDRAYESLAALVPRDQPGSLITEPRVAAARARQLALAGKLTTRDGTEHDIHPDSLCVHGDNPEAVVLLKAARLELESAGVRIRPFARA